MIERNSLGTLAKSVSRPGSTPYTRFGRQTKTRMVDQPEPRDAPAERHGFSRDDRPFDDTSVLRWFTPHPPSLYMMTDDASPSISIDAAGIFNLHLKRHTVVGLEQVDTAKDDGGSC